MRKSFIILDSIAEATSLMLLVDGFTNSPAALRIRAIGSVDFSPQRSSAYPIATDVSATLANKPSHRLKEAPSGHFGETLVPTLARNSGLTFERKSEKI